MAGTREGGLKAAETNKRLYGKKFYEDIGRKGGKLSTGGGFQFGSQSAREAGRRGGTISRRTK